MNSFIISEIWINAPSSEQLLTPLHPENFFPVLQTDFALTSAYYWWADITSTSVFISTSSDFISFK